MLRVYFCKRVLNEQLSNIAFTCVYARFRWSRIGYSGVNTLMRSNLAHNRNAASLTASAGTV